MILNLLVALAGWLAFNAIMLSMYKDDNEQSFNLKAYFWEHWDNWFASFCMIPILLYFGHAGLNVDFDGGKIGWNDAYYPASGFITEAVKMAYKKWKNKNQ